jgi:sugar phosphate isomerase/epimerase
MIQSAVTISLVEEARGGPFVFSNGLADGCARAAEAGFDAVEIFPRAADEVNPKELKQLLQKHGLKLAAMGTGAGWIAHGLRLTDPEAATRKKARAFVAGVVDLAGKLGAPAIVGSMQGRTGDGVTREQAFAWLREALEELGVSAQALSVPLLFEPLNRYETDLVRSVAEGLELLQPLRTKNVRLLVDLFHANIEEKSMPGALRLAGSQLGHLHFADSNRQAVGFGHTDLNGIAEALSEMGYKGYASAEILPLPDPGTAAAQTMKSFRKWFRD